MTLHHVVGEHHGEQWTIFVTGTQHTDEVLGDLLAHLEDNVLGRGWVNGQHSLDNLHPVDILSVLSECLCRTVYGLLAEAFHLLLKGSILRNALLDGGLEVLGIVEQSLDIFHHVFYLIDSLFASLTSESLDAAHTGSHAALRDDLEEADVAGALYVDATAELATRSKAYHTHLVAVFLTEESYCSQFFGFCQWHVAVLLQWDVLTNHVVDDTLHLTQLLGSDLLEVGEIETQCVGVDIRSLLLHMITEHLLEGIVEQVSS